jgi:hypothetical protein
MAPMPVSAPEKADLSRRALELLCSQALAPMVDMVLCSPSPGVYEAHAVDGWVRFRRQAEGRQWRYQVLKVEGRHPLGEQDPGRFAPLEAERAEPQPSRAANSYPLAFERVSQVFDHPCAPDLCVLHTAAHRFNPHRGEHGSLDVVQSRAPFIVSGAGIARQGMVKRHCRLTDVAPTVLSLLGVEPGTGVGPTGEVMEGCYLSRQDGAPVEGLRDDAGPGPRRVLCVLLDGANANVLYRAARDGTAPTVGRLIEEGTAFAHGALASLPTVTLANHTTLLTGAHPGHHGVLHNAWYDRGRQRQVVTESPATWQEAMRWLFPGVETVHEALHRHRPGSVTFSVNEPADRGADYSTFDLFRAGRQRDLLAEYVGDELPGADPEFLASSGDYRFGSTADVAAVVQASRLWAGRFLDTDYATPTFCWVSFTLTDAAFHEGGPHSAIAQAALRDTDARLAQVLQAVEDAGAADETAVVLVADHGMEQNEEPVTGTWSEALAAAGIAHRDEASGFLYLGEE